MEKKRIVERVRVEIPLPVDFPISVNPNAPEKTREYAENLETIRKRLESNRRREGGSIIEASSVGTPQQIMEELETYEDLDSIYLRDIYEYFLTYIEVSNLKTKDEIKSPKSTGFLPHYYYVFLIGFNSENKNVFTQKDLKKLTDEYISSVDVQGIGPSGLLKPYISKIIIRNLGRVKPDFYLSYALEAELYDLLPQQGKNYLISSIKTFRERFAEVVIAEQEHPICKNARLAWETPSEEASIPLSLVDTSHKVFWPSVKVLQRQEFVIDPTFSLYLSDLYISELAKFQAHLRTPGLAKFSLDMSDFMEKEADEFYNEELTKLLIKEKFLNTAGELVLESMNKENFVNCCAGFTATFFTRRKKSFSDPQRNVYKSLVQGILEAGQRKVTILKKHLEGFTPIKAFALLLQVLEVKSINVDPKLKDLFLPDILIKNIKSTLIDLFSIDRYVSNIFPPSVNFFDITSQKKIFELSKRITSQIEHGCSFILRTGTPIKEGKTYSEHAFYIVFKHAKESNHLKIIVVNGGLAHGMQDIDSNYVEQDAGFGGMWKCRETNNIALDESFLKFLKHYIYKVLLLPHLPSTDADGWRTEKVMKEIYFKYGKFGGYCEKLTFKPVINNTPVSFPSQVFGNCVTYNLFYAIKFLFELNGAQFTLLKDQLRCSYNYLLFCNDKMIASIYKREHHDGSAAASSECIFIEHPYVGSSVADTINVENSDRVATSSNDTLFNEDREAFIASAHKSFYDEFLRILTNVPYEQVEEVLQKFLREEETFLDDLRAVYNPDESQKNCLDSSFNERIEQKKKVRQEFFQSLQTKYC